MLPTRRALLLLAIVAPIALLGYLTPWGLDLVLGLDLTIVVLILIDARLAPSPDLVTVERQGVTSFSVGRTSEVTYRWTNTAARAAYLLVRESRPSLLGGAQALRQLTLPTGDSLRETLPVIPERRGRE